jgi:hypothetical protein
VKSYEIMGPEMAYPKSARDRGSNIVFNISLNSTFLAIGIFPSNLLNPISMEYEEEISSNEDEFNFSPVTNEIISKHRLLVHGEEEGSDEDNDEVVTP